MIIERSLFNLLLNATLSFLAGAGILYFVVRFFRIGTSRWKLYLCFLPFLKVIWDLVRGIPGESYLFTGIDPFALPPKHTNLYIGAGFSYGPILRVVLSITDLWNREYSISGADFFHEWLRHRWHNLAPTGLLIGVLSLSLFLVWRRVWKIIGFWFECRREERFVLTRIPLGWRTVTVLLSPTFSGSPFAGGLFRPYICFPISTYVRLSAEEKKAVMKHELAHIIYFDLLTSLSIELLGDILWFVPGYRFLSRKISRQRELLADETAVCLGAAPEYLASALLKVKETEWNGGEPISAFSKEPSLLKRRVTHLLEGRRDEAEGRFGWDSRWGRWLVTFWTSAGVLLCSLGGNEVPQHMPEWIEKYLRSLVSALGGG